MVQVQDEKPKDEKPKDEKPKDEKPKDEKPKNIVITPTMGQDSLREYDLKVEDESLPDLSEPLTPHITYLSYDEYMKGIESMCKADKLFMKRLKAFCDSTVDTDGKSAME
jgi:hypothetical protein